LPLVGVDFLRAIGGVLALAGVRCYHATDTIDDDGPIDCAVWPTLLLRGGGGFVFCVCEKVYHALRGDSKGSGVRG
jgi:hypothetical protein